MPVRTPIIIVTRCTLTVTENTPLPDTQPTPQAASDPDATVDSGMVVSDAADADLASSLGDIAPQGLRRDDAEEH